MYFSQLKKIVLFFGFASPLLALHHPQKSALDSRIRYTPYNAHDVVQLNTVIGIVTHIVLEEGETYLTHAFGDGEAYGFAAKANHLFLKPKAENADTNLVVLTDRRSYHFRLSFQPVMQASSVYQLAFTYPEKAKKVDVAPEFEKVDQGHTYNLKYTMSGDTDIAPLHTWDNGTFTYFKFAEQHDLPVIYMVDRDGQESMVNRHSIGENSTTVVVHKINDRWILRLGDRALAVFNKAYGAQPRLEPSEQPSTRTSVPTVQRVIKPSVGPMPNVGSKETSQ